MTIFYYQDYVHNNGILHRALLEHYGAGNVRPCDATDITGGILETASLLVIPGGADLYYCEKLNGAGNRAIRAFVEQGGTYLGICAGAYFACTAIDWNRGEIAGPRELGFYNGTATGPVFDFIEDGDPQKCWDAAATINYENKTFPVFYSAGPLFSGDENARILARYENLPGHPAALVECTVGKGRAILSSPHFEFDAAQYEKTLYRHRNASYKWQEQVNAHLQQGIKQQREWRKAILTRAIAASTRKNAA